MVILKWIQSVLLGDRPEITRTAAAEADREINKDAKKRNVDLINAALVDHAEDLDDLLKLGNHALERKRFKRNVRKKVENVIAGAYDDPDIIEDITERITDAAEVDPFYKRLFGQER